MGLRPPSTLSPGSPGAPLFYTFPMPKTVQQMAAGRRKTIDNEPRHKSFDFDFNAGDFRVGGDGKILIADGPLALVQRVVKIVLTERYAYRAYTRYFGTEVQSALKERFRSVAQTELRSTIDQALHWSIANIDVTNFTFSWNGDELFIGFDVTDKQSPGTKERLNLHL